jgi:hypothetical protein
LRALGEWQIELLQRRSANQSRCSNRNPLHPIERNLLAGARAFVRRQRLGIFERAARLEVSRDAYPDIFA